MKRFLDFIRRIKIDIIKNTDNKNIKTDVVYKSRNRRNKWVPVERDVKKSRCGDFGNDW